MAIRRFPVFNIPIPEAQLEAEINAALGADSTSQVNEAANLQVAEFQPGSVVPGKVVRVFNDEVFVDIGYKSEGVVSVREFDDPESITSGQSIEVYLEAVEDNNGMVKISKRRADRIAAWDNIIKKHDIGDVVRGRVVRKIKGGLLVDISVPAFLPASQVDIRRIPDVSDWVGREIDAKILKIDEERRNIVISRRKMIEEERNKMKDTLLESIEVGEVRRGIVKNITDFGAFIDLGGIDGLLHITDMSWGRVVHPSDVLKHDEAVEVMVLNFDRERERISLGMKQLLENPWKSVPDRFPIGSRHKGEVVNIVPYGAFVKLDENVEGLVHVSEMSWVRNIRHPNEVVKLGDAVEVEILEINIDKQEISLGMKQTTDNPWEQLKEKYPKGAIVEGVVRNLTNFGAFIEIEDNIDGLLHVKDISWTRKINHPSQALEKDQKVRVMVLGVDTERKRVALGIKQLENDPWVFEIPAKFAPGDCVKGKVTKLTSFGAFVEIGDDLEGLLHVSEMSDDKVEKPQDVLAVGSEVDVVIINVDPEERKIGLSMKTKDLQAANASGASSDQGNARKFTGDENRQTGGSVGAVLQNALREAAARRTGEEKAESADKADTDEESPASE